MPVVKVADADQAAEPVTKAVTEANTQPMDHLKLTEQLMRLKRPDYKQRGKQRD